MAENSHSSTATHSIVEQDSENEETEEIEDKDCKYVNKGRNTTNMRLHPENHHKEEMKKMQDYEKTAAEKKVRGLVDFFNKPYNSSKPCSKNLYPQKSLAYKTFKENLTRLAGCTSFPLSMVDSSHLHALLFHANSRIADCLLSRNTLMKWVVDYATKVKKNVIASLKAVKNFFVTMDIWQSLDSTNFILVQLIEKIFVEYDLDVKKVIRFTTDKGANVVNGLQPYKFVQYVKATPSLDQAEDPLRPELTDDAYVKIELDIEIVDEGSDDDEDFVSDNESDDEIL
ncbi:hypothetical protein GHT06_006749 [Daphnia sinensis]|uniref:Uncharacterized protein n=1 Tax=Daphnia sinensis TaxID=1820382 RepID=A0AAD5KVQ6_9CRUS|nr:hypothetical protein GHT06_006749 [Daphnia sinensis]